MGLAASPFFAPVQDDIEKLLGTLTEHDGSDFAAIASYVTFKSTGIDAQIEPAIFETLISAIQNREELELVYSRLNYGEVGSVSPKPPDRRVEEVVPPVILPWGARGVCAS